MDKNEMNLINSITMKLNLALLEISYLHKKSVNVKDAEKYINMGLGEIYEHKKYLENKKENEKWEKEN